MMSVVKKITQFYMRKGKKQGHEYSHTLCRHTPKTQNRNTWNPKTETHKHKRKPNQKHKPSGAPSEDIVQNNLT